MYRTLVQRYCAHELSNRRGKFAYTVPPWARTIFSLVASVYVSFLVANLRPGRRAWDTCRSSSARIDVARYCFATIVPCLTQRSGNTGSRWETSAGGKKLRLLPRNLSSRHSHGQQRQRIREKEITGRMIHRERKRARGGRRARQTNSQKWTTEKGTNGLVRRVRAMAERLTEGKGEVVTGIERSFSETGVTSAKAHHRGHD